MKEHYLDLIICIPLLWGLIRGLMRGLIFEIALLAALAFGLWGGFALAGLASVYLSETFKISGTWLHTVSFIFVFLLISLLIVLLGKLLTGAVSITGLGIFNRIAGGLFGMLKWVLLLAAAWCLIKPTEEKNHLIPEAQKTNSYLYKPMDALGGLMLPAIEKTHLDFKKESQ